MPNVLRLEPPQACVPLTELVARDGGTWVERPAVAPPTYALPRAAEPEVRAYLETAAVPPPRGPEGTAWLPGARVFGSGVVLSADGTRLARDVSADFGKPRHEHWLCTYRRLRPPEPRPGRTAVVATALGQGYAHWLLEEWPRWVALGPVLATVDTVLAHGADGRGPAAAVQCGLAGRLLPPRRTGHLACEHLVVPSLVGEPGWPTSATLAAVRTWAPPGPAPAAGWGERIYVSRARARRRRVRNEAELVARLTVRGFVSVCAEERPWAEQLAGFRAARVVVAPHGAGLANLAFCAPGTVVVELFARAYVNPCFWRLAAVAGLDYRPVVTAGPGPVRCELGANPEDFTVDVAAVERALGW